MNVIVSNKQKEIIDNANIDAIKDLNGLFNVNDLINKFKNYFFSKMILDATSVVDFASREVLTTLANEIGAEKLIILLPATPEPPLEFKKLLIELKIYNFTNNINDVVRFIERSNTYEDAVKLLDGAFSDNIYVDNSIKEGEDNTSDEVETNEVQQEDTKEESNVMNNNHGASLGDILSNLNLGNSDNQSTSVEPVVETEQNNNFVPNIDAPVETNINNIVENNVVNEEVKNVNENHNMFLFSDFNTVEDINKPTKLIIGVKNVTIEAGSTSLIYMLHKEATKLGKNVLSIEVGKNDFRLFRDGKMISVSVNELNDTVNNSNADIIFVDLNDDNDVGICNDVLYLVEPSTIKLNNLMSTNKTIFNELKNKKVVLNKSMLSPSDVKTLESEAGLNFFASIGPLNDRVSNESITKLLSLLGVK